MRVGRSDPFSWYPDIGVAIPAVVAGAPYPAVMGPRTGMLNDDGRRADLDIHMLREG
jgi:hypothetical protein